jgi:hypothetical protein
LIGVDGTDPWSKPVLGTLREIGTAKEVQRRVDFHHFCRQNVASQMPVQVFSGLAKVDAYD